MFVKHIETGSFSANCFLIGCEETKEALIIDPGGNHHAILKAINDGGWTIRYIVNTHGHYDHIGANGDVKDETGAEILIHTADAAMLDKPMLNLSSLLELKFRIHGPSADRTLQEGDMVEVGKTIKLKVIHTPGHTPGSIALYQDGHLFAGDTLFAYGIGRTDFPGGSYEEIMQSIYEKLLIYPDETKVYPGHNTFATLGAIKDQNPFIR